MNFRIGQRVRIINCTQQRNRHLVGREATIIGSRVAGTTFCYELDIDDIGAVREYDGRIHAYRPSFLAPIQPCGHQVTTWAEMADLWQPEHLRGVMP